MLYRNQLALLLADLVVLIARLISQLAWYISFPYQHELDKSGKLIRLHGGAQKIANIEEVELSRNQKKELHLVAPA